MWSVRFSEFLRALCALLALALLAPLRANAHTVTTVPFITYGPAGLGLASGGSGTLFVNVSGNPLTYQWYKDGVPISGASSSSYQINSATSANAGVYSVVVANAAGSVTSISATVTVAAALAPFITQVPESRLVAYGASSNIYVYASGTGPLSYQWFKDGVAILGATSYGLALNNVTTATAGSYTATVSNAQGSVTSAAAIVTIGPAIVPAITTQPASQIVTFGSSGWIYVRATGSAPLAYQWYKDGVAIAGATQAGYTLPGTAGVSGAYTVQVTNGIGSATSSSATVTVGPNIPPAITVQPQSQAVTLANSVNLSVSASGSSPVSYQWYNGAVAIPGATQSSLWIGSFTAANAGSYTVVATNSAGSATSDAAVVSAASGPTAAPVITSQSGSQTVALGAYVSFYVSATGNAPITEQWYKDGVAISGAINSYYTVPSVTAASAGAYTCVFTNASGSVTSAAAVLALLPVAAPTITLQPASQIWNSGDSFSLQVLASGNPAPSYQWFKDGVAIPNALSSSYQLSSATALYAGTYRVVVTNSSGSATSASAVVTVNAPAAPLITDQPESQSFVGSPFTSQLSLYVSATGTPPLTYQWYKNGTAIPYATSSSFYLASPSPSDAGSYTATVTNSAGSVTSLAAAIAVAPPSAPVITAQPASCALTVGNYNNLSVNATATGGYSLSYQWYKDGAPIPNALSSYYGLYPVTSASGGSYTVVVTDSAGSVTSAPATVSLFTAPAITTQPQNVTAYLGATATFSVATSSVAPVVYRWYQNGILLKDGTNVSGSATAALTLNNLAAGSSGTYTAVATSAAGSITSSAATLTLDSSGGAYFTATPPATQTAVAGSTVTLAVTAAGTPAPTYQWYFNNVAINGATSSSYSIPQV